MTPADAAARCTAAGLTVLAAGIVGKQIRVTVTKVPGSATGLATLTTRLGVGVTVSMGDGTGGASVWFIANNEEAAQHAG